MKTSSRSSDESQGHQRSKCDVILLMLEIKTFFHLKANKKTHDDITVYLNAHLNTIQY